MGILRPMCLRTNLPAHFRYWHLCHYRSGILHRQVFRILLPMPSRLFWQLHLGVRNTHLTRLRFTRSILLIHLSLLGLEEAEEVAVPLLLKKRRRKRNRKRKRWILVEVWICLEVKKQVAETIKLNN